MHSIMMFYKGGATKPFVREYMIRFNLTFSLYLYRVCSSLWRPSWSGGRGSLWKQLWGISFSSPTYESRKPKEVMSLSAWDKCSFSFGNAWDLRFCLNWNILAIGNISLRLLNLDVKQNRIFPRLACLKLHSYQTGLFLLMTKYTNR